jgi:hypothetical protein
MISIYTIPNRQSRSKHIEEEKKLFSIAQGSPSHRWQIRIARTSAKRMASPLVSRRCVSRTTTQLIFNTFFTTYELNKHHEAIRNGCVEVENGKHRLGIGSPSSSSKNNIGGTRVHVSVIGLHTTIRAFGPTQKCKTIVYDSAVKKCDCTQAQRPDA